MNRRFLLLAIPLLALAAAVAAGCGGGNGSPDPTGNGTTGTAGPFEASRDALVAQLEDIGVNIGNVPPDVGLRLLADCNQLETFADSDRIRPICEAIDQAMENNDPGLIDRVLTELAELTPD